jgi:hypothetical protein
MSAAFAEVGNIKMSFRFCGAVCDTRRITASGSRAPKQEYPCDRPGYRKPFAFRYGRCFANRPEMAAGERLGLGYVLISRVTVSVLAVQALARSAGTTW